MNLKLIIVENEKNYSPIIKEYFSNHPYITVDETYIGLECMLENFNNIVWDIAIICPQAISKFSNNLIFDKNENSKIILISNWFSGGKKNKFLKKKTILSTPITKDQLINATEEVANFIKENIKNETENANIILQVGTKLQQIKISAITYIEGYGAYQKFIVLMKIH